MRREGKDALNMVLRVWRLTWRFWTRATYFRLYLTSGLVAAVGRNGYLLGSAWSLATVRGDVGGGAGGVALFLLIASLSELLSSPVAGWLVDRLDRRLVYGASEGCRFAVILATGIGLSMAGDARLLYVSAIFFSICDRLSLTAYQALLPACSGQTPLMIANSTAFFMVQIGNLTAAILCGVLLSLVGVPVCLAVFSIFPAISALVLLRLHPAMPSWVLALDGAPKGFPILTRALTGMGISYALLYGGGVLVSVLGAPYILRDMRGTAMDFGAMEASWSAGSILGTVLPILLHRCAQQNTVRFVLLLLIGSMFISLACVGWPAYLMIFLIIGSLYNAGRVGIEVDLHRGWKALDQGRVKGFLHSLAMVLAIAIFVACAYLSDFLSAAVIFAVYGLFVFILLLLKWGLFRAGSAER